MPRIEKAQGARAEAELTALVSRCFLRPTLKLAEEVQQAKIADAFREILRNCPNDKIVGALNDMQQFCSQAASVPLKDAWLMLETDFNRLFVGPGKLLAVPYESFYKTSKDENGRGHLRGLSEQEVIRCYKANGFKMPDHFIDFADHIAIELEFLGAMNDKEADAYLAGSDDEAMAIRKEAEAFRTKHPMTWIDEFANDVCSGAHHAFYPAVVTIAQQTILLD